MPKRIISIGVAIIISLFSLAHVAVAETDNSQNVKNYYDQINKKQTEKEKNDTVTNNEKNTEESTNFESGFQVFDFVKMLLIFAFVIALLLFVLKWIQKQSLQNRKKGALELVGTIPVGQNKSVQLVKVGEKVFLIGVGDTVTKLKEFTEKEEIDRIISQSEASIVNQSIQNPSNITKQLKKQLEELNKSRQKVLKKFIDKGGKDRE